MPARRTVLAFFALTAVPAYMLLDLAYAQANGWWTRSDVYIGIAAACGISLALTAIVFAIPRSRRFLSQRVKKVVLAVAATAVAWLVLELAVGLIFGSSTLFHRMPAGYRHRFAPKSEFMPGISGPSLYTTNAQGIRGPELPARDDAYRILCIGGSTTACLYVDDKETWTHLLMTQLNKPGPVNAALSKSDAPPRYWSGALGTNSFSTREHVRLVEDRRLLRQFDCAVFLTGVNDVVRTLLNLTTRSSFNVRCIFERSNVYAVVRRSYEARKVLRRVADLEATDGSTYRPRRERRQRAAKRKDIPDLANGLADYERNIRILIDQCRRLQVRPVFLSHPVLWSADLAPAAEASLWLGVCADGRYLEAGLLAEVMQRFNDTLARICRDERAQFIGLSPLNGDQRYFYDDCHFTEAGQKRLAQLVAAALRGNR